jgi:hypothetical protein
MVGAKNSKWIGSAPPIDHPLDAKIRPLMEMREPHAQVNRLFEGYSLEALN